MKKKKKRLFSSLESMRIAFEGSLEITRQLLWARKVEGVSREVKNLESSRRERNTGMAEWRTIPIRCDAVWARICVTRRLFTATFTNAFVLWSQWRSTMIKRPSANIERRFVGRYRRNWLAANYFDGHNEVVMNAFYADAIYSRLGTLWLNRGTIEQ